MGSSHAGFIFWMGAILIIQIVTVHCEDAKDSSAACIKDKALTEDQTSLVTDDSAFTAKDVPENVKCYYKCLHERQGLMDAASGKPKADKVLVYLKEAYKDSASKVPQSMSKCTAAVKSAKGCDLVFQFEVCIRKELKPSK